MTVFKSTEREIQRFVQLAFKWQQTGYKKGAGKGALYSLGLLLK